MSRRVLALTVFALGLNVMPALSSVVSAAPLAITPVRSSADPAPYVADGVVEAVRQTTISAQIAGAITALPVKAGDSVKSGQLLVQMDARAAFQEASASRAQVDAARAALSVAAKDLDRQKLLFLKSYISQAQLDRADSQYQTASAQANAQIAQASAVQTQSGFYALTAPYAGLVADLPVAVGDMAMPGRPLLTIYDPTLMRVTVTVPQARVTHIAAGQPVKIDIPGMPASHRWQSSNKLLVLPVADAATHTVQVRIDLPPTLPGLAPGMFARVILPMNAATPGSEAAHLYVPVKSVFRRAELSAVYVVNAQGKPMLRQVRLGPVYGEEQEILSGVSAGEQVASDPLTATQLTLAQ